MHGERTFFARQLAEPGPQLAADDRSPVRQGHRRVRRHGAQPLPGRRERPADRGARSAGRIAAHALETVGADRLVALHDRGRAILVASRRRRGRRAGPDVGVPAGPRRGPHAVRRHRRGARCSSSSPTSVRTRTKSSPTCRPPASPAAPNTRARSSTARRASAPAAARSSTRSRISGSAIR